MTLIVNLYAGPGAGKSTTALRLTSDMKLKGVDVEYVSEFVKEAAWLGHQEVFQQPELCLAGQHRLLKMLNNKCDVVVCDSPINLTAVYATTIPDYPHGEFNALVDKLFKQYDNFNLLINRSHSLPYNMAGRNQNLRQAMEVDEMIAKYLTSNSIKNILFDPTNEVQYSTILKTIIKTVNNKKVTTT